MSASRMGVGVIGLRMGRAHAAAFAQNPRTQVVGVCDTDPETLARVQAEFKPALAVADYRDLIARPDIRIVSVATPDYYHAEHCIAALRAGKDVLCEKPLTLTVAEARSVVAAVRETGRRLMVGQVCRYTPGFALAQQVVERGDVGELFYVESEYAHNYTNARGVGSWRVDPRREPFVGGGCHAVDLLRWIAGDPVEVTAYANHKCLPDWPVNDCFIAIYRFPRNVIGKVFVSIGCVRPYTMRSVFYGVEGTVICDNKSPEIEVCSRKLSPFEPAFARFPVPTASHNVAAEAAELVEAILQDRPVKTDVLEGARTVAACRAAVESACLGRPVAVEEVA